MSEYGRQVTTTLPILVYVKAFVDFELQFEHPAET